MEKIKLFRALAKRFPKSIKSRGDRIGLMTGKLPDNINHILLCLDFDETVLNKVKEMNKKPDLILTHHPFIYGPRQRILTHNEPKRLVCEQIDKMIKSYRNAIPSYRIKHEVREAENNIGKILSEFNK